MPATARIARRAAFLAALALFANLAGARQAVVLDNGEAVIGEVLPISNDSQLVVRSDLLGLVTVPRSRVFSIEQLGEPVARRQPQSAAQPVLAVARADSHPAATRRPPVEPAPAEALDGGQGAVDEETPGLLDRQLPPNWAGDLRFGANFSTGDAKWREGTFRGNLEAEYGANLYRTDGYYYFRETEDAGNTVTSTDRYGANALYRRSFESDFFVQNTGEFRADERKGIFSELQNVVGFGYGLEAFDNLTLDFGGGAGLRSSDTDQKMTSGTNWVTQMFTEFAWQPLARTTLAQNFRYYVDPERTEDYNYALSTSLRYRITRLLGLEFSYELDYDNDIADEDARTDSLWRNSLILYF